MIPKIDPAAPHGARDRALFLFYVLCGRRRREVLELRGRDIRVESKKTTYRVRLKGGRARWKELPPPVWHAIQDYLAVSGRALEDDRPPVWHAIQDYLAVSGRALEDDRPLFVAEV